MVKELQRCFSLAARRDTHPLKSNSTILASISSLHFTLPSQVTYTCKEHGCEAAGMDRLRTLLASIDLVSGRFPSARMSLCKLLL